MEAFYIFEWRNPYTQPTHGNINHNFGKQKPTDEDITNLFPWHKLGDGYCITFSYSITIKKRDPVTNQIAQFRRYITLTRKKYPLLANVFINDKIDLLLN